MKSALHNSSPILLFVCALAYWFSCGHLVYGAPVSAQSQWLFARGINLSGGELNPERKPAVYGKDYIYPPPQELDYYASKGFAVVRLPYRWERLQPSLFGKLDGAELGRIKGFVAAAQARNMRVILSPHNFGRYFLHGKETLIGTAGVPIEAFADFSQKVAAAFADNDAVYALSLMNEPHDSNGPLEANCSSRPSMRSEPPTTNGWCSLPAMNGAERGAGGATMTIFCLKMPPITSCTRRINTSISITPGLTKSAIRSTAPRRTAASSGSDLLPSGSSCTTSEVSSLNSVFPATIRGGLN